MLSATPSRQPGEEFRRKVASNWGVSYAQLEALALGEDPPPSTSQPIGGDVPPNLVAASTEYIWTHELPPEMRAVVREQARIHYAHSQVDLSRDEWQRVLTGLEREALALAHRLHGAEEHPRGAKKKRVRPMP
jgi:hypothetical protein